MNTNVPSIAAESERSAALAPMRAKAELAENPVIQRALRRMKESQAQENHVSHYTKHSSYSTKHSSVW